MTNAVHVLNTAQSVNSLQRVYVKSVKRLTIA